MPDDSQAGKHRTPPQAPREEHSEAEHPPRTQGENADPHGTAPAGAATQDEKKGRPNSDRHFMETAVGRHPPKR